MIKTLEFIIDDKEYSYYSYKYRHLEEKELYDFMTTKANITTKLKDKFFLIKRRNREPSDFLLKEFRIKTINFITKYKDFLLKSLYRKKTCYAKINVVYK